MEGGVDLSAEALQDLIEAGYSQGELMALKGNKLGLTVQSQMEKSVEEVQDGGTLQNQTSAKIAVNVMQGKKQGTSVCFMEAFNTHQALMMTGQGLWGLNSREFGRPLLPWPKNVWVNPSRLLRMGQSTVSLAQIDSIAFSKKKNR